MNKAEWYADRILWKVGKLSIEEYLWSSFEISNSKASKDILQIIPKSEVPLVVFWKNSENWTLLTSEYLRGKVDGSDAIISLDDVSDVVAINEKNIPPNDFKREAEYVSVGREKRIFWTPPGVPHYSLRNILRVFPLNFL